MANTYLRNSDVIEMVGRKGSLRVVGRGGSLTSKTVDVSILDDVYKDYAEGNSPIVRAAAWKWYTTVVRTRLHNDSQELIVFTRRQSLFRKSRLIRPPGRRACSHRNCAKRL
jgi:hypothetical protein